MKIHRKGSLWIGVILFNIGLYFDYAKHETGTYLFAAMALAIALMLWSLKPYKKTKDDMQ